MIRLVLLLCLGVLLPGVAYAAGTTCPELSPLQQAVGYVESPGILLFLGGAAVLVGLGIILSKLLHFELSPQLIGLLGIALSAGLISYAFWAPEWLAQMVPTSVPAFIGALVLAPSLIALLSNSEWPEWMLSGILFVAWGILAVVLESSPIGFLAVLALLHLLGFSAVGGGLSYAIGWDNEKKIPSTTIVATLLAGVFATLRIYDVSIPMLSVFESGAFWVGTLCAGVGMLIIASKWYGSEGRSMPYALRQVLAIVVFGAGIYAGIVADEGTLLYIAGIFAFLFLIEKSYEIAPNNAISYGLLTVALGVAAIYGYTWLNENLDQVNSFVASLRS